MKLGLSLCISNISKHSSHIYVHSSFSLMLAACARTLNNLFSCKLVELCPNVEVVLDTVSQGMRIRKTMVRMKEEKDHVWTGKLALFINP